MKITVREIEKPDGTWTFEGCVRYDNGAIAHTIQSTRERIVVSKAQNWIHDNTAQPEIIAKA